MGRYRVKKNNIIKNIALGLALGFGTFFVAYLVEIIILSAGYIILSGIMGIKWGLLKKMTGSLYAGMGNHFFNNCIATNLVHVMTAGGFDDLMIVRIVIAQILSFILIVLIYRKNKYTVNSRA